MGRPHLRPHQLREGQALAGDIAQAGAEHEQEIGCAGSSSETQGSTVPCRRRRAGGCSGRDAGGRKRRSAPPALGEGKQGFSPAAPVEAAAGEHKRALSRRDHARKVATSSGCGAALTNACVCTGPASIRARGTSSGNAMTTGPGSPVMATCKPRKIVRECPGRIGDLRYPFGDAAEHAGVVDLLERVATQVRRGHLPDQQDQGTASC